MKCLFILVCLSSVFAVDSPPLPNEGLAIAIRAGDLKRVSELLQSGVSANAPSEKGVAPLIVATAYGKHEMMKLLIAAHANINAVQQSFYGATALMWAANNKDLEAGKILIAAGADVNFPDKNGDTAMNWSAYYGDSAFVQLLLDNKADPERTGHGNALEIAMRRGFQPLVGLLTKVMGKEPQLSGPAKNLAIAVEMGEAAAILEAIGQGADPSGLDRTGRPLLAYAARKGDVVSLRILLDMLKPRNGNPDQEDSIGFTALMEALRERQQQAVALLLERGANPNHKAKARGLALTPAHLAAIGGDMNLIKRLKEAGAAMDTPDSAGNTPAIWATMENQIPAAITLVEMGADTRRKNSEGLSLESMAKENNIDSLVEAIEKAQK